MHYANNYHGLIPLELYIKLQETFPQAAGESDALWLQRVKREPMLAQKMFGTPEFKTQLIQAVHQRTLAVAGATRKGHATAGPALIPLNKPKKPDAPDAKATIAERYVSDSKQYNYVSEAYDLLIEQFDAVSPAGGMIFWNGINEVALARLVDRWNSELGNQVFGQLEGTTAFRYVTGKFEWGEKDTTKVFAKFTDDVSGRLGHAARGHVTAVVRCGLRHDSIFTVTELPRMLNLMEEQIKAKQPPNITDLTIVVIEPKHLESRAVATFTNNEITQIPIIRPLPGKWVSRPDCTIDCNLNISARVRDYWTRRGPQPQPAAATKIKQNFEEIMRFS